MKEYLGSKIFTDFSDLSKILRRSIREMARYDRFDVGDEIKSLLRQIKHIISDSHSLPNNCNKLSNLDFLVNLLNHLEIDLTDCLEDSSLSLSGKFGISDVMIKLTKVQNQAEKWRIYVKDRISKKIEPDK